MLCVILQPVRHTSSVDPLLPITELPRPSAPGLVASHALYHHAEMIVTHTQNAAGQQRIYLGGKSSLECWIEPNSDKIGWTFHVDVAVTGNQLTEAEKRTGAIHTLLQLAETLDIAPDDLGSVPFEMIAALHATDPFAGRRIATPRRQAIDAGFMATKPNVRSPQADFTSRDRFDRSKHRG